MYFIRYTQRGSALLALSTAVLLWQAPTTAAPTTCQLTKMMIWSRAPCARGKGRLKAHVEGCFTGEWRGAWRSSPHPWLGLRIHDGALCFTFSVVNATILYRTLIMYTYVIFLIVFLCLGLGGKYYGDSLCTKRASPISLEGWARRLFSRKKEGTKPPGCANSRHTHLKG